MFPADTECGGAGGYLANSGDCKETRSIWSDALPEAENLFSGSHTDNLLAELSVPYEDIMQLEWLSTFVEDSFSSGGMTIGKESSTDHFQTCSPVSVLESSSSSSSSSTVGKTTPPLSPSRQRTRSKRPRPLTFNPRAGIQLIETPRPFVAIPSETENFVESPVKKEMLKSESKKKKKIKITPPSAPKETQTFRKCLHCDITKTPQWRAGPMGPKTLCNACGVRYKSGRLFPEYRPAASPTFIPTLHSNSHKKVIEMRTKIVDPAAATKII